MRTNVRVMSIATGLAVFALAFTACGSDGDEGATGDVSEEVSQESTEEESWEGVGEGLPEPVQEDDVESGVPDGAVRNGALLFWLDGRVTCHEDFDSVEAPLAGEVNGDGWHLEYYPDDTESGEKGMRVRATGNTSMNAGVISQDGTTGASIMKPIPDEDIDIVAPALDVHGGPGNYDGDTVTLCLPN